MVSFERDASFRPRARNADTATQGRLADMLGPRRAAPSGEAATEPPGPVTGNATAAAEDAATRDADAVADATITIAEDELAKMLSDARAAARSEAIAEVEQRTEAHLATAQTAIGDALGRALEAHNAAAHDHAALVQALVETIARHVVPRALAHHPLEDLTEALADLVLGLKTMPALEIAVHASLVELVRETLDPIAANNGYDGVLTAVVGPELAPGDATVRWASGEASYAPASVLEEATRRCAGWLAERDFVPDPLSSAAVAPRETLDEQ